MTAFFTFTMIAFAVVSILKGGYHFRYLKLVEPEQYQNLAYIEAFMPWGWRPQIQFLVLPYLFRLHERKRPEPAYRQVRRYFLGQLLLLLILALICCYPSR